jgi:hypothetical protein
MKLIKFTYLENSFGNYIRMEIQKYNAANIKTSSSILITKIKNYPIRMN